MWLSHRSMPIGRADCRCRRRRVRAHGGVGASPTRLACAADRSGSSAARARGLHRHQQSRSSGLRPRRALRRHGGDGHCRLAGVERALDASLYHQDGFLLLSGESMRPGGFEHESYSLLLRRMHPVERLDPRTRGERFPAWSPDRYPDGYFNPGAGWAESGKVLERLTADAQSAGVTLLEGVRCARLMENGSRTVGVALADGRELDADVVLVAAGAWTPALLPDLGRVMWATGQPVVHFKVAHAADWSAPRFPVWAADIARTGWYGFPALADGTLKIGHHGPADGWIPTSRGA